TYGFSPQADVRAVNIVTNTSGCYYDVELTDRAASEARTITGVHLPMYGLHNVQNSLAAIAVAISLGISDDSIRASYAKFMGVKRRFTKTGESNGVVVIDDYGHHPVEIAAVLKAARMAGTGRTIAVVQPHRYTRLQSLFAEFCTCFNDADAVVVADVYAAGEQPIEGAAKDDLVEGLRVRGHRNVTALSSPAALPSLIAEMAKPGDMVVCLGAGTITQWANSLPGELDKLATLNATATGGGD
ncbi:MAG: UDP-N-acetylmuramate--L-alanine ligase, partial [Niveispirillum sp.]|nr:UDP-N-acetylmuramate--L-alanine ligase [Niveispirillum sp.]